jgi:hypothetical protein
MKRLSAISIALFLIICSPIGTAFPQNLTDIEAEELIKQERALSQQESTKRYISEFSASYQGLLMGMVDELKKNKRDVGGSRYTWISKNPDDLKPLVGTKWRFTYTIIINFTHTIRFGNIILPTDEGFVGLDCYNENSALGAAMFTEMPYFGRGYVALMPGYIIDHVYFFQISGSSASGFYMQRSHSTGELSNPYPLIGVKISGPQAKPPVAHAGTNKTVDEGELVSLNALSSSDPDGYIASYLWQQISGPTVSLSSSTSSTPYFEAPYGIQSNVNLTFKLTVTDNSGLKDTDTVVITVRPLAVVPSLPDGDMPDGDLAPLGNPDGTVNVGDALVALRFALGLLQGHPTADELIHGDVAPLSSTGCPSPDGNITVGDALVILRRALGLINFSNCVADTTKLTISLTDVPAGTCSLGSLDLTIDYNESKIYFDTVAVGSLTSGGTVIPNDDGDTVRVGLIKAQGFDGGAPESVMVLTFNVIQPNVPRSSDFIPATFSATDIYGADVGLDFSNVSMSINNY